MAAGGAAVHAGAVRGRDGHRAGHQVRAHPALLHGLGQEGGHHRHPALGRLHRIQVTGLLCDYLTILLYR